MNEYYFMYQKCRKQFGKHPLFDDSDPKVLGVVEKAPDKMAEYVSQTINVFTFDNIPELSETSVNTERVRTLNKGMKHVEGGWPKDVDYSAAQDTSKWRKKLDKDPSFTNMVKILCENTKACLNQNNTIDLFEDYFQGEQPDHVIENLSAKSLALYKDPIEEKRAVSYISWHPEGATKLCVSYSILRFQKMPEDMPRMSFIWDVTNPNTPVQELKTNSPLICSQYQPKNPDLVAGGCYNGQVNFYDLRKGENPVMTSAIDTSHYDPVYDMAWLQSKTQSEFVTVSSDGKALFWDKVHGLDQHVESCQLTNGAKDGDPTHKTLGGVSLEWMQEAGPTKFLVGTEQGVVLSLNKKPKKPVECAAWFGLEEKGGSGKHFGPVYTVKRNPAHVKYFMTVGDWRAQIWMEELKGPMVNTTYHKAFLTSGAWSPTRAGLFMVTRADGWIDFWDYFYRMNEVALSHKVSTEALTTLAVQNQGSLAAIGDSLGTVTLLELCDGLVQPGPNEKNVVGQIFERETKREKNLEQARKQAAGHRNRGDGDDGTAFTVDSAAYLERENKFYKDLNINDECTEVPSSLRDETGNWSGAA